MRTLSVSQQNSKIRCDNHEVMYSVGCDVNQLIVCRLKTASQPPIILILEIYIGVFIVDNVFNIIK